jgi:HEAT repeat protein
VRETSGFFPQSEEIRDDAAAMRTLLQDLHGDDVERRWIAAEDLGAYPQALDALLAALPSADGDQTLFLCKALARLKDRRAIGPLLEKWKRAPGGAPGTRYIPDVLAAIGDRSVVSRLVAPLTRCRFDYRFHIVHALGILGGPEAQRALQELAANEPFPAVREEAARALRELRRGEAVRNSALSRWRERVAAHSVGRPPAKGRTLSRWRERVAAKRPSEGRLAGQRADAFATGRCENKAPSPPAPLPRAGEGSFRIPPSG